MNRRTSSQTAETLNLFSTEIGNDVQQTLEAYLAHTASTKRISDNSIETYKSLWRSVVAFCASLDLGFQQLGLDELRLLIYRRHGESANKKQLTARYAWRLLRLIDDVMLFDARERGVEPNRAARELIRLDYEFANARNKDALPDTLSRAEFDRFLEYAIRLWPKQSAEATGAGDWLDARAVALFSVVLGAGLTPRESADLLFENVRCDDHGGPERLRIQAQGRKPAREVPIEGWASRILKGWLQVRERGFEGKSPLVFPPARGIKALDNSSLNLAYRKLMGKCGISEISRGFGNPDLSTLATRGPFTFRHTFAVKARAEKRYEDDVLMDILGISDEKAFSRYKRIRF